MFYSQVDFAKVLHYVGAGVAFPSSMLSVSLQSALTYRLAKTQEEYRIGHLRLGMTLLALVSLVLSILPAVVISCVFFSEIFLTYSKCVKKLLAVNGVRRPLLDKTVLPASLCFFKQLSVKPSQNKALVK